MGISELYTPHASTGALWWYHTMIFEMLVLQCVHYKISPWDEENLTFIFQFPRFETECLMFIFMIHFGSIDSIYFYIMYLYLSTIFQDNPSEKDINQGTLVVFNLDPSVSNDDLRQIFGAYGEVKEVLLFGHISLLHMIFAYSFSHPCTYTCTILLSSLNKRFTCGWNADQGNTTQETP